MSIRPMRWPARAGGAPSRASRPSTSAMTRAVRRRRAASSVNVRTMLRPTTTTIPRPRFPPWREAERPGRADRERAHSGVEEIDRERREAERAGRARRPAWQRGDETLVPDDAQRHKRDETEQQSTDIGLRKQALLPQRREIGLVGGLAQASGEQEPNRRESEPSRAKGVNQPHEDAEREEAAVVDEQKLDDATPGERVEPAHRPTGGHDPNRRAERAKHQNHALQTIQPTRPQQGEHEGVESDFDRQGPVAPVDPARRVERPQHQSRAVALSGDACVLDACHEREDERDRRVDPDAGHQSKEATLEKGAGRRIGGRERDDETRHNEEHVDAIFSAPGPHAPLRACAPRRGSLRRRRRAAPSACSRTGTSSRRAPRRSAARRGR